MEVHLSDDQKSLVQHAIERGRYAREEDVLRDALAMWEERERRREEIIASLEFAEATLADGKGRTIHTSEEHEQFVQDVKARGRARLATAGNKQ